MNKGTVIVTVEGGCVTDVSGLPPGWDWELIDFDNLDAEEADMERQALALRKPAIGSPDLADAQAAPPGC